MALAASVAGKFADGLSHAYTSSLFYLGAGSEASPPRTRSGRPEVIARQGWE
jgi:hypothetical protein